MLATNNVNEGLTKRFFFFLKKTATKNKIVEQI